MLMVHSGNHLQRFLSIFLGCVFVFSGMSKSANVHAAANTVGLFCSLFSVPFLYKYKFFLAIAVCFVELLTGFLAFKAGYVRFTGVAFLILVSFFTAITFFNYAASGGSIESCGCFGEIVHLSPKATFYKNVCLLIASLGLFFTTVGSRRALSMKGIFKDNYFRGSVAAAITLPLSSAVLMNVLDLKVFALLYLILCSLAVLGLITIQWKHL